MGTTKKAGRTFENKHNHPKLNLEVHILDLGKLLQGLWKATLASNLLKKDIAEVLRLLVFAFTIIVVIILTRP